MYLQKWWEEETASAPQEDRVVTGTAMDGRKSKTDGYGYVFSSWWTWFRKNKLTFYGER